MGLERDHYDKHKWRGDAHTLSINDQKFYDHLAMKGSGGAIDLVMHVRGVNFKEAVGWLGGQVQHIPYRPTKAVAPSRPHPHPPFRSPVADETKWLAVKEYLVKSRGIPETLVNQLHEEGKVYADSKQNAVFLRQNPEGKITGASLRGTYQGSQFKGLATGTRRERGWFSITQGEGKLKRIVLTESPIDTLSAATVAQKPERTIFLSTDGAGTAPTEWLREQSEKGVQIIAAHDRDHAGEYQAWSIAKELTEVGRVAPKAKDWNEQLLGGEQPSKPEPQDWKRVAQALGKSDKYTARINKVIANVNLINSLSDEARQAMQEDFEAYQETTKELWQWHQAAKEQEKPQAYLERISEVALKFHSPNNPVPLSIEANRAMQYDLLDQKLREQYLDFKAQAKQNPNLQNSSSENIDITIALLAIRKNSQIAQNQGKVFEQVSNLLSQSDQVKDWKRSLPKGEYLNKAKQYIDKLYEQASQLGQDLSSKKQNEQLDEIER